MIRALIVDDERLARVALKSLLAERPDVAVVGEADGVASARTILATTSVDVIFLDVQMPGGSGFELASQPLGARVVFCTAYEQYAVRAFEVNALDYLVKPVAPEALDRALRRISSATLAPPELPSVSEGSLTIDDLVSLREGGAIHFARVRGVTFIQAADDYSEVHLEDGRVMLVDVTLRAWEGRLPSVDFVRIHRSSLVSLHHVAEVRFADGHGEVHLRGGGAPLVVSRRMGKALRERLASLGRARG